VPYVMISAVTDSDEGRLIASIPHPPAAKGPGSSSVERT